MNLLVCGGDPDERDQYAYALEQAGLAARTQPSLEDANREWEAQNAIGLLALRPSAHNLSELIQVFRQQTTAPLIVLSDDLMPAATLEIVRLGVDLVLSPPIDPRLVAAYCANLMRRAGVQSLTLLADMDAGGLRLSPAARTVQVQDGPPLRLTPLEFRLLLLLFGQRGRVVETDELIDRVWGYNEPGSRELARGLVSRLRGKLGEYGGASYIETVPGVGYMLRPNPSSATPDE